MEPVTELTLSEQFEQVWDRIDAQEKPVPTDFRVVLERFVYLFDSSTGQRSDEEFQRDLDEALDVALKLLYPEGDPPWRSRTLEPTAEPATKSSLSRSGKSTSDPTD